MRPKYDQQARELHKAYDLIYEQGGWTVYNDERFYIEDTLGIKDKLNMLQTQGRSKKITMVDGAQRPTGISRFVLSQANQVIVFGIEPDDLRTLASRTSAALAEIALNLPHHTFAWWNRITKQIWVGKLSGPNLDTLDGSIVRVTDTRKRRFEVTA